jgi:hypothetical protein
MVAIISPSVKLGIERSIMTAKVKSNIELIFECDVPPGTGEQSFLMQIHHGGGVKALSDHARLLPCCAKLLVLSHGAGLAHDSQRLT